MSTLSKISGAIQNNPTIQFYRELNQKYNERDTDNWRFRSYKQIDQYRRTPFGNDIYIAASKEIDRMIGWKEAKTSKRQTIDIEMDFGYVLSIGCEVEINFWGVFLYITTPSMYYDYTKETGGFYWKLKEGAYRIKYNLSREKQQQWDSIDFNYLVKKYFMKEYFYPEGIFRKIQVLHHLSKKETLLKYRNTYAYSALKKQEYKYPYTEVERAIKNRFLRHKNIELRCDEVKWERVLAHFKKVECQKKRMKLFKAPNPFDMMEYYSNEYDTDDHIEEFANNYYEENYPKNVMFI